MRANSSNEILSRSLVASKSCVHRCVSSGMPMVSTLLKNPRNSSLLIQPLLSTSNVLNSAKNSASFVRAVTGIRPEPWSLIVFCTCSWSSTPTNKSRSLRDCTVSKTEQTQLRKDRPMLSILCVLYLTNGSCSRSSRRFGIAAQGAALRNMAQKWSAVMLLPTTKCLPLADGLSKAAMCARATSLTSTNVRHLFGMRCLDPFKYESTTERLPLGLGPKRGPMVMQGRMVSRSKWTGVARMYSHASCSCVVFASGSHAIRAAKSLGSLQSASVQICFGKRSAPTTAAVQPVSNTRRTLGERRHVLRTLNVPSTVGFISTRSTACCSGCRRNGAAT
mmetsp:Transcript_61613/g.101802  ORF Transcript_61613/g.101802 Transcript_61613/m.101802 type:complete len:334 (-) Transcript_61613:443-1444(-)